MALGINFPSLTTPKSGLIQPDRASCTAVFVLSASPVMKSRQTGTNTIRTNQRAPLERADEAHHLVSQRPPPSHIAVFNSAEELKHSQGGKAFFFPLF